VTAMDRMIRLHLPQAEYTPPQGGYFFWLRLPGVDTVGLRENAREHKVSFHPGRRFSGQGALLEYLRLSYVNTSAPEIEKGLQRLAEALSEFEFHSRL
jgi:2-aminoadipate transaminase